MSSCFKEVVDFKKQNQIKFAEHLELRNKLKRVRLISNLLTIVILLLVGAVIYIRAFY